VADGSNPANRSAEQRDGAQLHRGASARPSAQLLMMMTATHWLDNALAFPARDAEVWVDGVRVAYRLWEGAATTSTVVLVHGGAAHSRWWDPVAPLLAKERRVIAIDLSGH